jgi:hypothetical protein
LRDSREVVAPALTGNQPSWYASTYWKTMM